MEDSRVNVPVSGTSFVDVYSAMSVAVGTKLAVQNLSSCEVLIYVGASPSEGSGFTLKPFEYYTVPASTSKCWVKSASRTGGHIGVELGGWSIPNAPIDERVYTGLKGLTIQNFTEANSKNGSQFEMCAHTSSVLAGANFDIVMTVGSKPTLIKHREISYTGDSIETKVYKGTIFTGGTSVLAYNMNTKLLYPSVNTIVHSPTVSNAGTLVSAVNQSFGVSPQGNKTTGSYSTSGIERVLEEETAYLLRITNTGAETIKLSVHITWYEGEISSLN